MNLLNKQSDSYSDVYLVSAILYVLPHHDIYVGRMFSPRAAEING